MSNPKPILTKDGVELTPVEQEFSDEQVKQIGEYMQTHCTSMIQEQIMRSITPDNIKDVPLLNPNEKLESLTEDEILQTKQLNDKISSQNLYIKQSQADLKEEFNKRAIAEDTLSVKDWKLAIISGIIGLITGVAGTLIATYLLSI